MRTPIIAAAALAVAVTGCGSAAVNRATVCSAASFAVQAASMAIEHSCGTSLSPVVPTHGTDWDE